MGFGEKVEISEAYVSKDWITGVEEAADQITKESAKNEIYEVKSGDTLSTIANGHGLYVKEVLALNSGLSENTTHVLKKYSIFFFLRQGKAVSDTEALLE